MTSINDVRLVGVLKNKPVFKKTQNGSDFAELSVETEKFIRIRGEPRRIAQNHNIVCYNQYSISFLREFAKVGRRVKVLGELEYTTSGTARIVVHHYNGEVAAMDIYDAPDAEKESENTNGKDIQSSGGMGSVSQNNLNSGSAKQNADILGNSDTYDDEIPF